MMELPPFVAEANGKDLNENPPPFGCRGGTDDNGRMMTFPPGRQGRTDDKKMKTPPVCRVTKDDDDGMNGERREQEK